jgi:hypothetical protein
MPVVSALVKRIEHVLMLFDLLIQFLASFQLKAVKPEGKEIQAPST